MDALKTAAAPRGQLSGIAQPAAYRVEMTVDPRETAFLRPGPDRREPR
jgi:hypothetical protein